MLAHRACVDVATLGIFERWRSTMDWLVLDFDIDQVAASRRTPATSIARTNESQLGHLRSICDTIAADCICRIVPLASMQEILTTAMVAMEVRWRQEVATVHRKKATDRLAAAVAAES